jgi:hypothetical protein
MVHKQLIVIAGAVPAFLTVLIVWRYAPPGFLRSLNCPWTMRPTAWGLPCAGC